MRNRKQHETRPPAAMAIAAHPDDIEFLMAGTLLLLKVAGYEIHCMTVANGSCGSLTLSADQIKSRRKKEAKRACKILGARFHPSLVNDLEIVYDLKILRRLAAVIREVQPRILLVPSPQDYMEDHTNTCRLAVSAAFARGMPNFRTVPARRAIQKEVTLYHAMPHGLRDPLRQRIIPGLFVNTITVHERKREALAAHESQQVWLDTSQQINSYLQAMEEMSSEVGRMSRRFEHAEGWRRHLHYGFCGPEADPLGYALKDKCLVNESF